MSPHWAALAAAEYLGGVWFDGIGQHQAWELTTAAFQETLRLYLQQLCDTAHSFTPEESDGALQRATQQMLLWRQQEEN